MEHAGQSTIVEEIKQATTGQTFEALRKRLGLSRREVAELAEMTPSRVWTIERSPLAQDRQTLDARRILEALERFQKDYPNGKPRTSKPRTSTATLKRAVKVALDGLMTIAATEEDALRRSTLNELIKQITAAAFEEASK